VRQGKEAEQGQGEGRKSRILSGWLGFQQVIDRRRREKKKVFLE
jgi:hypothetical protein